MRDDRDRVAALNNAEWCGAVWRSHGLPVERAHGMWFCPRPTPRFYPNVVTVDAEAETAEQAGVIAELATRIGFDFSVKDSFACLDLTTVGLRTWFNAHWLRLRRPAPPVTANTLDWRRIDDEPRLAAWERAWRGVDIDSPRIFRAELLDDPSAFVLAGYDATNAIRAGGIAYEAAGATGITNVFGSRQQFLSALLALSGPAEIVCYQHTPDLTSAMNAGFEMLGSLKIWVLAAQAARTADD
jgi:hypothetical protein